MKELCLRLGINKTCTTPYHPQSDGQVGRFNRIMKAELAKRLFVEGNEWDQILNQVAIFLQY